MYLTRIYKSESDDVLRTDSIVMRRKRDNFLADQSETTWERLLTVQLIFGAANRSVSSIEIVTDASTVDGSSYAWAEWVSPHVRCSMIDLPSIGDTV